MKRLLLMLAILGALVPLVPVHADPPPQCPMYTMWTWSPVDGWNCHYPTAQQGTVTVRTLPIGPVVPVVRPPKRHHHEPGRG